MRCREPDIVVAGNEAQKFAEIFHLETRRPMANGVLNPHEPHSLAVIRRIIGKLLGRAAAEGQKVFFSVPAPIGEGDGGIAYHEASMRPILTDLGYAPTPIQEGLAVVFGELAASNFTGIGVSCGSGLVQRLPRRVVGARAQFQRPESRGLHRLPGRRGHRRPRHPPACAEGTDASG